MNWVFAIINGRLAELFFEKKRGKTYILSHANVKPSEYKTRHEQKMIREDTKKCRFTYRKKQYIDQFTRKRIATLPPPKYSKRDMLPAFSSAEDAIAWLNKQ